MMKHLVAGGVILKHKTKGDKVYWCIITSTNEEHGWAEDLVKRREEEIKSVSYAYSFEKVFPFDYPTRMLDQVPMHKLISSVEKIAHEIEPEIVYLPFPMDVHTDHQAAFKALFSCIKNLDFHLSKKCLHMNRYQRQNLYRHFRVWYLSPMFLWIFRRF